MAWIRLGFSTLGSAGDDLDITGMTASKSNTIIIHTLRTGTGTSHNKRWLTTLDNNTNTDYSYRSSFNGGSDSTAAVSQQNIDFDDRAEDESEPFAVIYCSNVTGKEKLFIMPQRCTAFLTGANNQVYRVELSGKCDTTTNSGQFTRIDVHNDHGGSYDTGSNLSVIGSDGTEELNVQDGAIYYDTDLNKEYVLYNNTWTEV